MVSGKYPYPCHVTASLNFNTNNRLLFIYYTVAKYTGIPMTSASRLDLEAKYTDGKTPTKSDFTLTRVAQVIISVEEGSAIISHDKPCDLTNQDLVDSLYAMDLQYYSFKDIIEHYVKLDNNAGKKFCNFIAYLSCQHTSNQVDPHRCKCPPTMIWQDNKCVFGTGQQCDAFSGFKAMAFPVFDFVGRDFTRRISSNCQNPSTCRHGKSNMCEVNDDFDYFVSPFQISEFIRNHINSVTCK